MTIKQIAPVMSKITPSASGFSPTSGACSPIQTLTAQLTASLKRPTRKTLSLIDKALSYLTPFESAAARTASASERKALLLLLNSHRPLLAPYLDTDRIEAHLRHSF